MKITGLFILILLGLAGCTSTADIAYEAQVDLRPYRHLYVQSSLNDSNHLDVIIANELQRLGFDATAGVRTMIPDNAQVVITYETQWNWDFHTYLIQLDVTVRDVATEKLLGHGRIFHAGFKNKTPEKMVAEVLQPMFGPLKTKKK